MIGLVYNGAEGCKNMLTKSSYLKKLGEVVGGGEGGGRGDTEDSDFSM